jgi:hypothetical protein
MRPSCGATISLWAPSGLSYLVRAVFKDSSFMRRVNLEYIQTFNTNPAPIDLPPRCMLALMSGPIRGQTSQPGAFWKGRLARVPHGCIPSLLSLPLSWGSKVSWGDPGVLRLAPL